MNQTQTQVNTQIGGEQDQNKLSGVNAIQSIKPSPVLAPSFPAMNNTLVDNVNTGNDLFGGMELQGNEMNLGMSNPMNMVRNSNHKS